MSLETFDLDDLEPWEDYYYKKGEEGEEGEEGEGEHGEDGEYGEHGEEGEEGEESDKEGKGKGKGKKSKGKGKSAEDVLDKHTDDHDGGQEEGSNMDEGEDVTESELDKIDEHYKRAERALNNKKDLTPEEAENEVKKGKHRGGRGEKGTGQTKGIDISQGRAHFSWQELIRKFISTISDPEPEESLARPSRNAGSGMYTLKQTGMASIKPGEILIEENDAKLCFVIDSSGSMSDVVSDIYANINGLLANNGRLGSKIFAMLRFSTTHEMFRCIFKGNKAAKINKITEAPKQFNLNLDTVFKHHYGDSTNLTSDIIAKLSLLKKDGYNLIIFSDSDICFGENLKELVSLTRAPGGKIFIILATQGDWNELNDSGKVDMSFVSCFDDKNQNKNR